MESREDDAPGFSVLPIDLGAMIPKDGYLKRLRMESQYGGLLVDACQQFQPDVVISGNTPSLPQKRLAVYCRKHAVRHVFWVQDIYGLAAYKLLRRKLPGLGHLVGHYFLGLDKLSARLSDGLVVITKDFIPVFQRWGIDPGLIHTIHNWSVLEELPMRPRENQWSREQGLTEGPRFVYTGTLSMKHNPALLLELAKRLQAAGRGELIVVSEGLGIEWLKRETQAAGLKNVRALGFQPFEVMADVLGSADVLVAVLESDAGVFCVPSKVLSYMCAGRAILAAMPGENLAARTIVENQMGKVVEPDDIAGFSVAAMELLQDKSVQLECGEAARQYAEAHFDIEQITSRFESILSPGGVPVMAT